MFTKVYAQFQRNYKKKLRYTLEIKTNKQDTNRTYVGVHEVDAQSQHKTRTQCKHDLKKCMLRKQGTKLNTKGVERTRAVSGESSSRSGVACSPLAL